MRVQSLGQEIPWRRKWQPTPLSLAWEIPWTEEPRDCNSLDHKSWTSLSGWTTTTIYAKGTAQLEKAMAPHSSTLARKIPWTEEPGGLQSMGSQTVGYDWATSLSLFTFMHWRRKWQPTPVFLPGVSQGRGSLVGCHLWGRTESDTTEAIYQQQQQSDIYRLMFTAALFTITKRWKEP